MHRIRTILVCIALAGCSTDDERRPQTHPEATARADRVERSLVPTILIEGEALEEHTLRERMTLHGVPAVSVAVLRNGTLEWARAYGVAEVGVDRAVDTATLFQAASISKPIAAMAALRLVQDGRLRLDTDVNEVLTSWQVPPSPLVTEHPVTLRGLLTHTAGLSTSGFPGYRSGQAVPTPVQVLNGEPPANTEAVVPMTEPGSAWSYSGGGYTVLQVLLQDVTATPFPALLDSVVLRPTGMRRSFFGSDPDEAALENAAFGHRPDGRLVEGRWHRYPELAAAGLWTTPTDLLLWASEVLASAEGRSAGVLTQETTRRMLEPGLGDWGLGPEISADGTRFLHTGGNQGYRCLLAVAMDGSVGVAVMTNSDNGAALMTEIAFAVARVYGWQGEGLEPQVRRSIATPQAALEDFVGRYPAPGDREVVVRREGDDLVARSEWFREQPLYAESDDTFFLRHGGTRLRFTREGEAVVLDLFGWRLERSGRG